MWLLAGFPNQTLWRIPKGPSQNIIRLQFCYHTFQKWLHQMVQETSQALVKIISCLFYFQKLFRYLVFFENIFSNHGIGYLSHQLFICITIDVGSVLLMQDMNPSVQLNHYHCFSHCQDHGLPCQEQTWQWWWHIFHVSWSPKQCCGHQTEPP